MTAKSTDIKNLIVNRINALGLVQSIYEYEELSPDGWPCAWVINGSLDGRFVDTANNRRVYAVDVTVSMPTGQDFAAQPAGTAREKYIEDTLSDTIDAIINDLDENFTLDGTTVLFVDAADYAKGVVKLAQGDAKAVKVTLLVNTDYEVR